MPAETLPAGHPGFMAYDAGTGLVQVLMQQTLAGDTQIIGVDPVNGGLLVLADHANADCCLLTPGQTPSQSQDGDVIGGCSVTRDSTKLAGRMLQLDAKAVAYGALFSGARYRSARSAQASVVIGKRYNAVGVWRTEFRRSLRASL